MKLYEATVTIYISAENTGRARSIAAFETPQFLKLWEIYEADGVNADWWKVIPYGDGPDDKTCGDYVRPRAEPEAADGEHAGEG